MIWWGYYLNSGWGQAGLLRKGRRLKVKEKGKDIEIKKGIRGKKRITAEQKEYYWCPGKGKFMLTSASAIWGCPPNENPSRNTTQVAQVGMQRVSVSLFKKIFVYLLRLPRWLSGKESACQCKRLGFDPWIGKIPWRRKWQPASGNLRRKFHGRRSLVGYSSWHLKGSNTTDRLSTFVYLAASGLSCGTLGSLLHVGSFIVIYRLSLVAVPGLSCSEGCEIPVPWSGIKLASPVLKGTPLDHWEVPGQCLLQSFLDHLPVHLPGCC